jgi:hypothetical protein
VHNSTNEGLKESSKESRYVGAGYWQTGCTADRQMIKLVQERNGSPPSDGRRGRDGIIERLIRARAPQLFYVVTLFERFST